MLVLARKVNEKIVVGTDIVITVLEVGRGQVRLGIEAPKSCRILRHELVLEVSAENQQALAADGLVGPDALAALGDLFAPSERRTESG